MECTVVIPTTGGPYLGEQLRALAEQSRPAPQVVVVNNGPPGAVTAEVERWTGAVPGLGLVEDRSSRGAPFARNVGVSHATRPGLLFLDHDDVAGPEYVEAMSDALDSAPVVAARMDVTTLNPPALGRRWEGTQAEGPMTYPGFLPWAFACTLGFRRDAFRRAGGFDVGLVVGEDMDLCWRAQLRGLPPPAFVPRAVLRYRLRTTPGAAFRQGRTWGRGDVAVYRRYRAHGYPPPDAPWRALLRWGRPPVLLLQHPDRDGRTEAARLLGERIGRLQGSVAERRLFL